MIDEKILLKELEDEVPLYHSKIRKIIQQLVAEYNNGWISCKKELPTKTNTYLVTKVCENDGDPIYDTCVEIFWTKDNAWDCECNDDNEWKVIAWQEKFLPYKEDK